MKKSKKLSREKNISWFIKRQEVISYLKNMGVIKTPDIFLILGSSFGDLANEFRLSIKIPFSKIPHFAPPGALGHRGYLHYGKYQNKCLAISEGRLHLYEGHDVRTTTLLVNAFGSLGCKILITTNLAGGCGKTPPGSIVILRDQIYSLFGNPNPVIGLETNFSEKQLANVFYSPRLIKLAENIAQKEKIKIQIGTIAFVTGPTFETTAELDLLTKLKADVIGWSLCPETLTACYHGMEVLGISCVSDSTALVDLNDLYKTGKSASSKASVIIKKIIQEKNIIED